MPRIVNLFFAGGVCLAVTMVLVAARSNTKKDYSYTTSDVEALILQSESTAPAVFKTNVHNSAASVSSSQHSVIVRKPLGPLRIELAGTDPQGRFASVACSTCHAVRKPNHENVSAATLDEFHQGMTFDHGKIACYACHNPSDADALRLADGTSVPYENVMALCSQCHSKQAESFAHGAHGGMNGHWDLTRGPQVKNNCIDCHDPHAPTYPKMVVGFKAKDRFNPPPDHHSGHKEEESHDDH